MDWDFVQGTSKAPGTASSIALAFPSNVAAGDFLIAVCGGSEAGDSYTSVTDNLNGAWTYLGRAYYSTTYADCELWCMANSQAGAITVTGTLAAASNAVYLIIAEYSDIATASPLDQMAVSLDGRVAAITAGPTAALAAAGELVIGAACSYYTSTFTPGTGFTSRVTTTGENSACLMDATASSTAGQSFAATVSGTEFAWGGLVAVFLLSGSAPTALTGSGLTVLTGQGALTQAQSAAANAEAFAQGTLDLSLSGRT